MGIGVAEEEARRHNARRKPRNSKLSYKSIRSTVKQWAGPIRHALIHQNGGQLETTHIRFHLLLHCVMPFKSCPERTGIHPGRRSTTHFQGEQ